MSPNYRQVTQAGQGYVFWAGMTRDSSGFGYMDTWQVIVGVPQGMAAGETWISARLDALTAALEAVAVVTRVAAAELTMGETSANTIVFEVVAAH